MTITRTTILDLATAVGSDGNDQLKNLLLTVAGMLSPGGQVCCEPDLDDKWQKVSGCEGQFGIGMMHLQNRGKQAVASRPRMFSFEELVTQKVLEPKKEEVA